MTTLGDDIGGNVIEMTAFTFPIVVQLRHYGVQFLWLRLTASMRRADGTLPELWDTPMWVWRHGIPNETKYVWLKPFTEHKTRQISIHAQWK